MACIGIPWDRFQYSLRFHVDSERYLRCLPTLLRRDSTLFAITLQLQHTLSILHCLTRVPRCPHHEDQRHARRDCPNKLS